MCCFFLSLNVHAEGKAPAIKLILKPNICILSELESHCDDLLVAEWVVENQKNYSLCLFQQHSTSPIACWNNVNIGRAEFTQAIAVTTVFELRDMGNQTLLGREVFQVINAQKKYQRARRNPWSFF
jgi:hypothetical protein